MKERRQLLAQLVHSDDLKTVNPQELRAMLAELDDQVAYRDVDGEPRVNLPPNA